MSARRPLLTATTAASVLFVLWFVPSAKATVEDGGAAQSQSLDRTQVHSQSAPANQPGSGEVFLADTGSVDTTPYLMGGTAFLGLGAALVTYAIRRSASSGTL